MNSAIIGILRPGRAKNSKSSRPLLFIEHGAQFDRRTDWPKTFKELVGVGKFTVDMFANIVLIAELLGFALLRVGLACLDFQRAPLRVRIGD